MQNRHEIAWAIQNACNPMGVAHELIAQMRAFQSAPEYTGTTSMRDDPALRAIAYKLADLFAVADWDRWSELHNEIAPKN